MEENLSTMEEVSVELVAVLSPFIANWMGDAYDEGKDEGYIDGKEAAYDEIEDGEVVREEFGRVLNEFVDYIEGWGITHGAAPASLVFDWANLLRNSAEGNHPSLVSANLRWERMR